jgi:hypothetical protein
MTITVDFSGLHPAAYETWTAIARLVASTNTQTWAVVGRQMVAIHATVWGVELPRATDDGDIADALVADGFDSAQSPEGIVRFMKRDAKIDLLAPDCLGADPVETGKGRVVQAPGATQAVKRAEPVIVSDSRFDKEKHERDLATLLRCAARDPKLEQ